MSATKTAKAGPGRPVGIDSGDTRQRVIDAACRCFAQFGYGPATNNQIAEMAGVTAGSVYYHFGTKNKLFEAVCDDVYRKILASAAPAMAGPHSMHELLRAALTESIRINREYPELAGFVATAPIDARRHQELSTAFARQGARMTAALAHSVAEGQRGGLIPAEYDPVQVARVIAAIVDGFAHAAAVTEPSEMEGVNRLFESLLLDATAGKRPAKKPS
ncbi:MULTISPECIES: TetR/AcrR family transcriptional regulator [unclassified Mycolicibacterium]|uniref:TetR/AcrR family transcriptional regulator n=1 Tax=unclassified Mycolicibacterium TaxID=2636767 RepID=UPI0012DEDAA5|nr:MULTISPECIES: TetR/AcrR family transcriptional regulator [unclassified Mycolicibacterium]MUL81329.1 TetR/AcrR family transcriptional regulator [Mycolicibacterium sp. CBMA 329]MUL87095.1 TetR/AcrR family transcriptional regulator [Mycolicibacterium sp. CBMA 331]MUL98623.1 TetR/AcrR family transcriptional regulator [Mycolicibacterium sp. CBMA 334]MUM29500.1 TetR/AcrR family transcriptional regulator [Mycolicibacterium sp. CBMA 295]MUM37392.1 TetR/AcrR family transcriptional regulator [Mycolic